MKTLTRLTMATQMKTPHLIIDTDGIGSHCQPHYVLTLKVLVTTIDALWEGIVDVGSARYEPALLPPCPTIMVLSYSN